MEPPSPSRLRNMIYPWAFLILLSLVFWALFSLDGYLEKFPGRYTDQSVLPLASSSESGVRVDLELEFTDNGWAWLSAHFTPLEPEYHLYAKDLPRQGIDGLGRPTLLELATGSKLRALGTLLDDRDAKEEVVVPDQPALAVYPLGPVTLRLPVELPTAQKGWIEDQVTVTYMACSLHGCLRPVVGKIIPVHIPASIQEPEGLLQANLKPLPSETQTLIQERESQPTSSLIAANSTAGFSLVQVYSEDGDLLDQLRAQSGRAHDLGQKPFVLFTAGWCQGCRYLEKSFSEAMLRKALQGTYIIRLDLDDWDSHLGGTGFAIHDIPVFFQINGEGRPTSNKLESSAWGKDTPSNISSALMVYFNRQD